MTALTIILPHKRNPGNDAALRIALEMLYTNTINDFVLISDAAHDQPLYERVNRMVEQAMTMVVVYFCSDMFAAPAWDVPMLSLVDYRTFVTGVVAESGIMGMHPDNVHRDFGRRPDTFRRADFEAWALEGQMPTGVGFPAPFMFHRARFINLGGLQTSGLAGDHQGFTPADLLLFEQHERDGGTVRRAQSYFYHLQRYSELDEQTKEGR